MTTTSEMAAQTKDPNFVGIQKVGAAVVHNRKVIALRKVNQPSAEYYMAGGKIEEGETQAETLARELEEELQVKVTRFEYLGTYEDEAVFEGTPIRLHAYAVEIDRDPSPASEVKEYRWFDSAWHAEDGVELSSILAAKVIPALLDRGLID